jgi:hypothetical protein
LVGSVLTKLTPTVGLFDMRPRTLPHAIDAWVFADRKIAVVAGPRQCGKTTRARMMLRHSRLIVAGAAEALGYFA